MASRDFLKHTVSPSEPTASSLGDEWYNPTTNRLYKRVVTNGTLAQWVEVESVDSTGTSSSPQIYASNGIVLNSNVVSSSYTIPNGANAMSTGPVTVASGVTVTIPAGSKWMVL